MVYQRRRFKTINHAAAAGNEWGKLLSQWGKLLSQVTDDDVIICKMPVADGLKTEKKRAKTLKKCLHT